MPDAFLLIALLLDSLQCVRYCSRERYDASKYGKTPRAVSCGILPRCLQARVVRLPRWGERGNERTPVLSLRSHHASAVRLRSRCTDSRHIEQAAAVLPEVHPGMFH
jgi:hypothetical protein